MTKSVNEFVEKGYLYFQNRNRCFVSLILWESEIHKCGFIIKLIKKFNKLNFRTLELLSDFNNKNWCAIMYMYLNEDRQKII